MGWATIRKFGLGHCDLPTMLWNVSVMLRILTLNIDNRYTKRIPLLYYFISGTIAASYFYVFLFSMAWFVTWRGRQIGDMVQTMVVGSLGITSEIGTTKLIFMFFYRHEFRKLVDLYLACDSLVKPGSRFAANLMKILRRVKKRAIFFWVVIIGNGVVYIAKPFILPGRHFMEDYFIVYGLEPKFESPNYEITLLLMTGGTIFTCYLPANISAFLIIITGYTEAQMRALTEEISQLWSDAQLHYHEQIAEVGGNYIIPYQGQSRNVLAKKNKIINEYIRRRLYEIVKIHTTNINLLHLVENVYRGSIAAEFLLLTFGVIIELLGRLENTYMQIPFALIQVAMDCFCGQRVMDASAAFEHAVYACKWEQFDVPNMKTILLMLQMSQKTMRLSAGGVTMLSFRSLAGVIRIIYSGITGTIASKGQTTDNRITHSLSYYLELCAHPSILVFSLFVKNMWEQLRKFGMGHCDLQTMVWNVAFMLRGLALNIDTRYKGSIPMIFYIILPVLIVCYLYAYFISTIWFVFVRCVETRDLTAAMIVFSLGTTSEIGIAKFINACINRKKILVLIQEYLKYDAETVEPGSRFSKNLLKNLRNVKRRAIIYWVVIISNGILYICKPFVTPGQKTTEDKFIHYKLEPQFETPNYQLNYIFSAAGSILTCYPTANMAAFLIIVAGYVEAQLLALSEELFNLWDDAEQQYMYAENVISQDEEDVMCKFKYDAVNELITMKLRKIIIGHTTMIQFMLQVKEIFRGAFAFEFIILSVGLISELLGGLENTYPLVPFAIIQVGMDCFTGQRVIDACEFFEYAVYSCKWERFNVINRRTVFLVYMNSQKTLTLSAGGIAILSFTTLMSLFRSIYSAFATLQSVM